MKNNWKRLAAFVTALAAAAVLTACGGKGDVVASVTAPQESMDAVAVVKDIATTQYFTAEAVSAEDIETIVQAGINAPSAMNAQPWHFSVITDATVIQEIADGMGGGMGGGKPFGGPKDNGEAPFEIPGEGEEMPFAFPFGEGEVPFDKPAEGGEGKKARPEGMMPPEGKEKPAMPQGGMGGSAKAGIGDAPLVIVISCAEGSALDAGLACQNMSVAAQLLGYGSKIISSPTMVLNGAQQDTYRQLLGIPKEYSAAAILLVGYEDTSVSEDMDGFTGATARNSRSEVVTYITSGN